MPRRHLTQLGIGRGAGARRARESAGYPRPLLRRAEWMSLDGAWDFALDVDGRWTQPRDVRFDRSIEVPFAPEAPASGIGETSLFRACWYRRAIDVPKLAENERLFLHFGAVDY